MNREAELEPPSRVACSDLLDGVFILFNVLDPNIKPNTDGEINKIIYEAKSAPVNAPSEPTKH